MDSIPIILLYSLYLSLFVYNTYKEYFKTGGFMDTKDVNFLWVEYTWYKKSRYEIRRKNILISDKL